MVEMGNKKKKKGKGRWGKGVGGRRRRRRRKMKSSRHYSCDYSSLESSLTFLCVWMSSQIYFHFSKHVFYFLPICFFAYLFLALRFTNLFLFVILFKRCAYFSFIIGFWLFNIQQIEALGLLIWSDWLRLWYFSLQLHRARDTSFAPPLSPLTPLPPSDPHNGREQSRPRHVCPSTFGVKGHFLSCLLFVFSFVFSSFFFSGGKKKEERYNWSFLFRCAVASL